MDPAQQPQEEISAQLETTAEKVHATGDSSPCRIFLLVRAKGFEPPRVAPQDPKSCASASSATPACGLIITYG